MLERRRLLTSALTSASATNKWARTRPPPAHLCIPLPPVGGAVTAVAAVAGVESGVAVGGAVESQVLTARAVKQLSNRTNHRFCIMCVASLRRLFQAAISRAYPGTLEALNLLY